MEDGSPKHITASGERLREEDGRLRIDLEIRKMMKIAETHSQKLRTLLLRRRFSVSGSLRGNKREKDSVKLGE